LLALIQPHAGAIQHAWIARRIIGADADARCYVLGVQASWWTRLRRKDKTLIQTLARSEWPLEMHVCLLSDHYKPLRKAFKALQGAQLK